ncbi:MAG: hypothetical protein ABSA45_11410, partial [Verrucomicrobiota bacterium]
SLLDANGGNDGTVKRSGKWIRGLRWKAGSMRQRRQTKANQNMAGGRLHRTTHNQAERNPHLPA